MDAMAAAIRARRGMGAQSDAPMPAKPDGETQPNGMKSLVESLNDDQKKELLAVLSESLGQDLSPSIQKDGPSTAENIAIAKQANEESDDFAESGSGLSQDESDDIQASLVDRNAVRMAEQGAKPRNLSERAKMNAATKLKSKGKL